MKNSWNLDFMNFLHEILKKKNKNKKKKEEKKKKKKEKKRKERLIYFGAI